MVGVSFVMETHNLLGWRELKSLLNALLMLCCSSASDILSVGRDKGATCTFQKGNDFVKLG